jgi:hypothetical protein
VGDCAATIVLENKIVNKKRNNIELTKVKMVVADQAGYNQDSRQIRFRGRHCTFHPTLLSTTRMEAIVVGCCGRVGNDD